MCVCVCVCLCVLLVFSDEGGLSLFSCSLQAVYHMSERFHYQACAFNYPLGLSCRTLSVHIYIKYFSLKRSSLRCCFEATTPTSALQSKQETPARLPQSKSGEVVEKYLSSGAQVAEGEENFGEEEGYLYEEEEHPETASFPAVAKSPPVARSPIVVKSPSVVEVPSVAKAPSAHSPDVQNAPSVYGAIGGLEPGGEEYGGEEYGEDWVEEEEAELLAGSQSPQPDRASVREAAAPARPAGALASGSPPPAPSPAVPGGSLGPELGEEEFEEWDEAGEWGDGLLPGAKGCMDSVSDVASMRSSSLAFCPPFSSVLAPELEIVSCWHSSLRISWFFLFMLKGPVLALDCYQPS